MITLKNGEVLQVICRFSHIGAAFTGAMIRAAIGDYGVTFNEKLYAIASVTGVKDDATLEGYQVAIPITIAGVGTTLFPAKAYSLYAKMYNIPGGDLYWYSATAEIDLVSLAEAAFSNLSVTYQKG